MENFVSALTPRTTFIRKALRTYIVGHTEILRRLLVAGTKEMGAELVGQSDCAEQAIREILALRPDFVVLALVLRSGKGSGFDVLRALQTSNSTAPAARVVLTAQTTKEDRANSFRLGATHFFDRAHEAWRVIALVQTLRASPGTADPA